MNFIGILETMENIEALYVASGLEPEEFRKALIGVNRNIKLGKRPFDSKNSTMARVVTSAKGRNSDAKKTSSNTKKKVKPKAKRPMFRGNKLNISALPLRKVGQGVDFDPIIRHIGEQVDLSSILSLEDLKKAVRLYTCDSKGLTKTITIWQKHGIELIRDFTEFDCVELAGIGIKETSQKSVRSLLASMSISWTKDTSASRAALEASKAFVKTDDLINQAASNLS